MLVLILVGGVILLNVLFPQKAFGSKAVIIAAAKTFKSEKRMSVLQTLSRKISSEYGLDPKLLIVLGAIESSWDPSAIGDLNEKGLSVGLYQIHFSEPAETLYFRVYGQKMNPVMLLDPEVNTRLAAELLKEITARRSDIGDIFSEYNAGPIRQSGNYPNPDYVRKTVNFYNSF